MSANNYKPIEKSPELAMISEIMTDIENGSIQKLTNHLSQLPLAIIDLDLSDEFLVMLLTQAWLYGQDDTIPAILDAWKVIYPKEERIPFYVHIASISTLNADILSFVYIDGLKSRGITYMGIMTEMMNNHNYDVGLICSKITEAFGKINYETLLTLQQIADKEENAIILNFLNEKIRKNAPYQDVPSWVLDFRNEASGEVIPDELLPSYEDTKYIPYDIDIKVPSTDELIAMYDKKLIETDLSKQGYINAINDMTSETKEKIFRPMLERQAYYHRQNDSVLFRLYGPSMMSVNPTLDELKYGGERMFLTVTNPEPDDTGMVQIQDWFTGSCDVCLLKIKRRWHAVRKPIVSGGWYGCFCSWRCVRLGMAIPKEYDGLPDADIMTRSTIDQIETQMNMIGIQDRKDNGEIIDI